MAGGHGAHTQDGRGLSVPRPASLARFRVRAPRWWRRRAAGWHIVRLPDPSLWWRRDQTPKDCGRSGRSLTGEARVVGAHWGRRGARSPAPAALRQVTGRRVLSVRPGRGEGRGAEWAVGARRLAGPRLATGSPPPCSPLRPAGCPLRGAGEGPARGGAGGRASRAGEGLPSDTARPAPRAPERLRSRPDPVAPWPAPGGMGGRPPRDPAPEARVAPVCAPRSAFRVKRRRL